MLKVQIRLLLLNMMLLVVQGGLQTGRESQRSCKHGAWTLQRGCSEAHTRARGHPSRRLR